jgi:hypothetical protein
VRKSPKKAAKTQTLDREFFADARRKAWARKSETEKKAAASKAARGYWDSLTPGQRSAEMKRRAKVRAANKLKKEKRS